MGVTPAATVFSIITTDIDNNGITSIFIRVGLGEYYLKQDTPTIIMPQQQMIAEEELAEEHELDLATQEIIEKDLIKSFSMICTRDYIF